MKLINSIFLLLVLQLSFSQEKIKIDGIPICIDSKNVVPK